ncbi:MAG: hypothetical protein IV090_20425 [Candidatus Sericytochromatia bacterium]|nr:hypothetical protein [Candidatus Sericytochromatia bacterium]
MNCDAFKGDSTFLPFAYSELEARAVSLIQLLGAQPLSLKLKPETRESVERLANAYRKAQKSLAFQLSADFFAAVLDPIKLQRAYAQILVQPIIRHSEFQMVLDCLKELCAGPAETIAKPLPLEEALQFLLLKLTQSDKNAIYYNRIDSCTGKLRPTTFPLTETLIDHFLAPFAETGEKAKKVLIFQKGLVMANPALLLAWEYRARKQKYEQEKSRWEARQAAQKVNRTASTGPLAKLNSSHEPRLISEELEKVLASLDGDERSALTEGLKPDNFGELLNAAHLPGEDFSQTFKRLSCQGLSQAKASLLAARMSVRLKRLLAMTGDWDEDYWRDFQSLMQTLGLWEGQVWLNKWRANKLGKQTLEKSGKDYLLAPSADSLVDPLAAQLKQAEKMRDKQRGKHMLTPVELTDWIKPPARHVPPEQRKVLAVLARSDRLEELLSLSLPPEVLMRTSAELQTRLYQVFGLLADTDMDTIKALFLTDLPPETSDAAKSLIASVERSFHRLSSLFRQDFRMTFPLALKMLREQEELVKERQKMNQPQYLNSPAAKYQSYQQGIG